MKVLHQALIIVAATLLIGSGVGIAWMTNRPEEQDIVEAQIHTVFPRAQFEWDHFKRIGQREDAIGQPGYVEYWDAAFHVNGNPIHLHFLAYHRPDGSVRMVPAN